MTRAIGLNFHGVGTPARKMETGEAPYWLSKAQFIDTLDRIAAAPNPGAYVITFDDGNISDHEIALPALVDHGLQATFFVLTGRIGMAGSLEARTCDGAARCRDGDRQPWDCSCCLVGSGGSRS